MIRFLPRANSILVFPASLVVLGLLLVSSARGQTSITAETLRDEHVIEAIDAIAKHMLERKDADRFWEPADGGGGVVATQGGGFTALVTLSLLYAGASYQDDSIRDAVAYLERTEFGGTYAVGIRSNVWSLLPPKFESALERDKRWLLESFSERAGGWNYTADPYTTRQDNSIRQYGTLGLWEAAKRGLNVPNRYWQILEDSVINLQLADGGWDYNGTTISTGSMTTAGLTVLFVTQDFLHANDAVKIRRNGSESANENAIKLGLEWMDKNFSAVTNPNKDIDYYYYMYGVERVGLASGYKFFGGHDWYREGAAELINRTCAWDPISRTMTTHEQIGGNPRAGEQRTEDLAFSLMFLTRGRVPVAMNKLRDHDIVWNNRPRDVANLTGWVRSHSESGVNWQIVGMEAEPESWLDAPLLYFASNQTLPWVPRLEEDVNAYVESVKEYRERERAGTSDENNAPILPNQQLRRIRTYLDLGGTVLAVSEGDGSAFADSIERLGRLLYPQYEWRELPADHSIYSIYQTARGARTPLRAISNGVREMIILSREADLSEHYQAATDKAEDAFNLGMNVYLYASEMNRAKPRLELHVLDREDAKPVAKSVSIARGIHSGAWDCEPLALQVFSAWAWNTHGLDVQMRDIPLDQLGNAAPQPDLVIVSGIESLSLQPDELASVRDYVQAGGTILFETTGGIGDFTTSVEGQLRQLFGRPARSLLRHSIITGDEIPGAESVLRLEYRPFSFSIFGAREITPRLRGIVIGEGDEGAMRVLFSREDICNGLLDQPCWGVAGYAPPWARQLLANIVQYASMR